MKTETKKLPKSQLELTFELTPEEFQHHFEHAIEHLKHHIKVDGFRPGQAPAKMVEDKIKPEALLMEAGEHAVGHVYTDYVKENKLEPIGEPEVKIMKIAKGSEFIFKATITVLPDVELPDYKNIASRIKSKEISVTEEEVQDALNYLQKSRAKMSPKNDAAALKDFVEIEYSCKEIENGKLTKDQFILGEGGLIKGFEDNLVGMKEGQEKEFLTEKFKSPFKVKMISVQKMELPEINDEFAKQLGRGSGFRDERNHALAFDTLVTLKTSMKEGMTAEKQEEEKQRKRAEILEKIAEKSKFEMPEAMVDYEKQRLMEDLKNKITNNMKLTFEQYLSAVKKTEQEIKDTFQKEAEKRLRGFLVLRQLGRSENIEVSREELDEEMTKVVKNYSAEQLKRIDINELKEYTKGVLFNEKVFQNLELN